jgi:hypothetical protein
VESNWLITQPTYSLELSVVEQCWNQIKNVELANFAPKKHHASRTRNANDQQKQKPPAKLSEILQMQTMTIHAKLFWPGR